MHVLHLVKRLPCHIISNVVNYLVLPLCCTAPFSNIVKGLPCHIISNIVNGLLIHIINDIVKGLNLLILSAKQ